MCVIALVSGKGSPGVTTSALALALAWPLAAPGSGAPAGEPADPSEVLMVDADPAGCGLGPGYLRGAVPDGSGLLALTATREDAMVAAVRAHAVALDPGGRRLVLPGIRDVRQAASLAAQWPRLSDALASLSQAGTAVVVDLGRLGTTDWQMAVLGASDVALVVSRSSLTSVCGARSCVEHLQRGGHHEAVGALLAGQDTPYSTAEISRSLTVPVTARMAWDPVSARVLSDGEPAGWRFPRSPLLRSARAAVPSITGLARHPVASAVAESVTSRRAGAAPDGRPVAVSDPGVGSR